jgi:hypothetical protein
MNTKKHIAVIGHNAHQEDIHLFSMFSDVFQVLETWKLGNLHNSILVREHYIYGK